MTNAQLRAARVYDAQQLVELNQDFSHRDARGISAAQRLLPAFFSIQGLPAYELVVDAKAPGTFTYSDAVGSVAIDASAVQPNYTENHCDPILHKTDSQGLMWGGPPNYSGYPNSVSVRQAMEFL